MSNNSVLIVEKVSKKFCKNLKRSMYYGAIDVIKSMAGLKTRTDILRKDEFWAVDEVSFELKKGMSLGIIGENGSGKSTLLRLLSGIYQPDKGRIIIKGRVGTLLSLGAGFHPLMTGRENIYLNATILGMKSDEIKKKFKEIVEFAEIEDFIDAPVKTYSSGMYVRLGFSIAIHAEPDILLVDEVLAVGDVNFQKKCFEAILEKKKNGTSIIFVSHSISAIERLCTECMLLKQGKQIYLGNARDCIRRYFYEIGQENLLKGIQPQKVGIGDVIISDVYVYQEGGDKNNPNIEFGKNIIIEFKYKFLKKESNKNQVRIGIRTFEGRDIQKIFFHETAFIDNVIYPNEKIIPLDKEGMVQIKILNPKLFPQTFRLDIAISSLDMDVHLGGVLNAAIFNIIHPIHEKRYFEYGNMSINEFDYEVKII